MYDVVVYMQSFYIWSCSGLMIGIEVDMSISAVDMAKDSYRYITPKSKNRIAPPRVTVERKP